MTEDRIPSKPPYIAPVPPDQHRPLWSVMIPTYNCSKYLKQTLESVLLQDPGADKMQIEVVDDGSSDADVRKLVAEIGKGRIDFFQQPENRGSLRNFETCLNRARGSYIHLLHGDDWVEPGFYKEIEDLFTRFPEAGAAYTGFKQVEESGAFKYSHLKVLDEPGIIKNWLSIIAQGQKIQPPAMVVKRNVYEQLGGFFGVHYGEDWEMWTRIASQYPVAHSPKLLAHYRMHQNNISGKYYLSGQNIKDIVTVIDIIQQYLPPDQKKTLMLNARRNWSHYFARTSDKVYDGYKSPKQAVKQAFMAFKLHSNRTSLFYLAKNCFKLMIRYKM